MEMIDSTSEILLWKYLNKSVDEKWKEWAYAMLNAGFNTEHLVELAGIVKPYNQFELQDLTSKVFEELNLDYSNKNKIYKNYINYLVNQVLEKKRDMLPALRSLKDVYLILDQEKDLQDFAHLYWAKEDLNYDEMQWYWPGADRSNIDKIILEYFKNWKNKNFSFT